MHAFLIHDDQDLQRAIELVDSLWDAEPGTPEGHLLAVMATLVDQYEARQSTLPPGDPVEIVVYKLQELKWSQRELARRLGWSSGRVSEVLNRKRRLTVAMIQQLSNVLDLPPGLLVPQTETDDHGVWVTVPPELVAAIRSHGRIHAGESMERAVVRILEEAVLAPAAAAANVIDMSDAFEGEGVTTGADTGTIVPPRPLEAA